MSYPAASTLEHRTAAQYVVRLFVNGSPYQSAVPGASQYQQGEFRLPLAPQQVKLEARSRHQVTPLGLEAAVDEHGVTPPEITISGTFGEAGNRTLDGRQWHREFEALVRYYLEENYRRGRSREPLLSMSWHDTYRVEHWFVHPITVPYGSQDVSSPYREQYQWRLQALRRYDGPVPTYDPLEAALQPAQHGQVLANRNRNAAIDVSDPRSIDAMGDNIEVREVTVTLQPTGDPQLTTLRHALFTTATRSGDVEAAKRIAGITTWDDLDTYLEQEK